MAKLSPTHRQNFESWQKQVVKACNASDAFGLIKNSKLESDGIDGAALIKSNGGSVLFSDNENLVIITSYNPFSGTGSTKVEESQQINEQGYKIR